MRSIAEILGMKDLSQTPEEIEKQREIDILKQALKQSGAMEALARHKHDDLGWGRLGEFDPDSVFVSDTGRITVEKTLVFISPDKSERTELAVGAEMASSENRHQIFARSDGEEIFRTDYLRANQDLIEQLQPVFKADAVRRLELGVLPPNVNWQRVREIKASTAVATYAK